MCLYFGCGMSRAARIQSVLSSSCTPYTQIKACTLRGIRDQLCCCKTLRTCSQITCGSGIWERSISGAQTTVPSTSSVTMLRMSTRARHVGLWLALNAAANTIPGGHLQFLSDRILQEKQEPIDMEKLSLMPLPLFIFIIRLSAKRFTLRFPPARQVSVYDGIGRLQSLGQRYCCSSEVRLMYWSVQLRQERALCSCYRCSA